ncbi:MAG TPA: nucleotide exchange factor GrpE [Streptosporangiaceae bacterium]|nr:nucleotide exchange factor GrpE [Streptosporangiaceae bacterium]
MTPVPGTGDGCHTDTPAGVEPDADPAGAAPVAEEPLTDEPPTDEEPQPEEPLTEGPLTEEPPTEESQPEEPLTEAPQPAVQLADVLAGLTSVGARVDELAAATAELARLRTRDTDLIARLHDDVTKLRTGEISAALNPVVNGMIKLLDQMVSLGALNDVDSPVGMLHTQLLQILELTCAVKPFTPAAGERFDASRHTGARRMPTTDSAADGTIAGTIKPGFARADGSIVRVAEVEVHRLSG